MPWINGYWFDSPQPWTGPPPMGPVPAPPHFAPPQHHLHPHHPHHQHVDYDQYGRPTIKIYNNIQDQPPPPPPPANKPPTHDADYLAWLGEKAKLKGQEERRLAEEMARLQAIKEASDAQAAAAAAAKREQELIAAWELRKVEEAKAAAEARAAMLKQIEEERKAAAERDAAEWQAFLDKKKAMDEAEEARKKKEKEDLDRNLRAKLHENGYDVDTIELIINPPKDKKVVNVGGSDGKQILILVDKEKPPGSSQLALAGPAGKPQVWSKIHRSYLEVDTLRHYRLPWHVDGVS